MSMRSATDQAKRQEELYADVRLYAESPARHLNSQTRRQECRRDPSRGITVKLCGSVPSAAVKGYSAFMHRLYFGGRGGSRLHQYQVNRWDGFECRSPRV